VETLAGLRQRPATTAARYKLNSKKRLNPQHQTPIYQSTSRWPDPAVRRIVRISLGTGIYPKPFRIWAQDYCFSSVDGGLIKRHGVWPHPFNKTFNEETS
jgi:hypothetical protein